MKNLKDTIIEKLVITKDTKEKIHNIYIENVLKYLEETYNTTYVNKLWVMDEFYDQHYDNSLLKTIEKDNNIILKIQHFFCTKPIFSKKEAESLCNNIKQEQNNDYNDGILYVKVLDKFGLPNTYRVGIIYDCTLDLGFINSEYNKS